MSVFFFLILSGICKPFFICTDKDSSRSAPITCMSREKQNYFGGCMYHHYSTPSFSGLLFLSFRIGVLQRSHPIKKRSNVCSRFLFQIIIICYKWNLNKFLSAVWGDFYINYTCCYSETSQPCVGTLILFYTKCNWSTFTYSYFFSFISN